MYAHEYILDFRGYKLEGSEDTFEHESGIYCVYACTYNSADNTVGLKRLLYIGQADDFYVRHRNHNKKPEWKAKLHPEEMLCYSRAHLDSKFLDVCEAAMIFKHKPECNDTANAEFHHDSTHIVTIGKNKFLFPEFTVNRTAD